MTIRFAHPTCHNPTSIHHTEMTKRLPLFPSFELFSVDRLEDIESAMSAFTGEDFHLSGDARTDLKINRVLLSHLELYAGHSQLESHVITEPLNAFVFVFTVAGSARCGDRRIDKNCLICFNIGEPIDIHLGGPDNYYVMLRLQPGVLQALFNETYNLSTVGPLRFPRLIPIDCGPGRTIDTLMRSMINEMSDEKSLFSLGITSRRTEELFLMALLHNTENFSGNERRFIPLQNASQTIRNSVRFIKRNLQNEISVSRLADEVGVSPRHLQSEFARHFQMGPASWIKKLQLHKTRHDIESQSCRNDSITKIAASWGFTNPSNFASLYRKEFGELPSETRKRRQSPH